MLYLIGRSVAELPPLTLLYAPAGAGKTIAAAQWSETVSNERATEIAWVYAPESEVDAGQFWVRMAAALDVGESDPVGVEEQSTGDARQRLERLLSGLRRPTVVVIDDFQFVSSGRFDTSLARLLERSPNLHLIVLSTRLAVLDGPLVSSRVNTRIITGEQLAFTEQECHLLARACGVQNDEAVAQVWKQSHGWPIMVRSVLKLLSEGGDERDIARTLNRFCRQLLDEVEEPGGRSALLAAALCPGISLEMLSQLLSRTMSQTEALTRRLVELGLLSETLWADTSRFHCHDGLYETLLALTHQEFGEEGPAIQQRHATDLGRDDPIAAVKQLLDIKDYEDASRLLTRYFLEIMRPGNDVLERLRQIPDEVLRVHPALIAASLLLETPEVDAPPERLEQLYQWLREAVRSRMLEGDFDQNTAVIASLMVAERMRGDMDETLRLAKDIELRTSRIPENRLFHYRHTMPLIFSALAFAGLVCDDLELAKRNYGRAMDTAGRFSILEEDMRGSNGLAAVAALSSDLPEAVRCLQMAEALSTRRNVSAPALNWLLIAMVRAILACERYDAQAALDVLAPAMQLLKRMEQWPLMIMVEARAHWMLSGPVAALESIRQRRIEAAGGFPATDHLRHRLTAFEARLHLASGNIADMETRLAELPDRHPEAHAVRAMHSLRAENADAAIEQVEALATLSLTHRKRTEMLLVHAGARWLLGESEAAFESLDEAAALMRRYELRLPLSAVPHALLKELVRAARGAGVVDLVDQLRAVPASLRIQRLESLTKAESRILALLAEGRAQSAIAEELFISVNTVKFHLKSIYRKLAVSSRDEARARARELRLVQPEDS